MTYRDNYLACRVNRARREKMLRVNRDGQYLFAAVAARPSLRRKKRHGSQFADTLPFRFRHARER
jgi:hypothetical protein